MFSKTMLALCLLVSAQTTFGASYIDLPSREITIKAENIYDRIDEVVSDPEDILTNYTPRNVGISNKKVSKNQVQYYATKKVLGISKTILVKGTLDIFFPNPLVKKCFQTSLDFAGSDGLIYDNIEKLEMSFCTEEIARDHLKVSVKSRLLKSSRYGGIMGGITKDVIADQVSPILDAVKSVIEKK